MNRGMSFVVCCHDAASRLPATLEHLAAQQLPAGVDAEVVLVDNGSTDRTAEVARGLGRGSALPLRVVYEPRLGLSRARKTGVRISRFDALTFVDDDNWLAPDWTEVALGVLGAEPSAGAVGGSATAAANHPLPDWLPAFGDCFAIGEQAPVAADVTRERGYLWGAGLVVRRAAWEELFAAGFDFVLEGRSGERLTAGDDSELCHALRARGWRLLYEPRLRFRHFLPPERTRWRRLCAMNRGFGESSIVLETYLLALRERELGEALDGEYEWGFRLRRELRELLRAPRSLAATLFAAGEGSERTVLVDYTLGRIAGLLHRSRDFADTTRRIREFVARPRGAPAGAGERASRRAQAVRASVVVPTSSRPAALAQTLGTLCAQRLPPGAFEIIVVENGERVDSRRVVESVARRHSEHRVRYLHEAVPGLLAGRHRGALEARGEIVLFVDDDVDADPDWLTGMVESFEDRSVGLVGGRSLGRFAGEPPAWLEPFWWSPPDGGRACVPLSLLDLGECERTIDANFVWGLNFGIRGEALLDLGGFHPDNLPDALQCFQGDGETGLTAKANAAGVKAVYQPRALVHHRIPAERLTRRAFHRRGFYQGVCDSFTELRRTGGGVLGAARTAVEAVGDTRAHGDSAQEPPRPETVARAHRAGADFHREAVRRSPELLDWVLRPDYWDYRLPELPAALTRVLAEEAGRARESWSSPRSC